MGKLIDSRASLSVQNEKGFTPLHVSLYSYKEHKDHTPKIERLLLAAGADINITDNFNRTPIFCLFLRSYPTYSKTEKG